MLVVPFVPLRFGRILSLGWGWYGPLTRKTLQKLILYVHETGPPCLASIASGKPPDPATPLRLCNGIVLWERIGPLYFVFEPTGDPP